MELTYPDETVAAFDFNVDAGMSLSSVNDYSANTTSYSYEDDWNAGTFYDWMPDELSGSPYFYTHYGDPTKQTDAMSQEKTFAYSDLPSGSPTIYRILNKVTDELGTVTDYQLDSGNGLCDRETITDSSSTTVRIRTLSTAGRFPRS